MDYGGHKGTSSFSFLFFSFLRFYLFLERGREGETEGQKQQGVVACHMLPTGDLACNPGMYPDWELNWRPFGLQACTQSTEPHQPGRTKELLRVMDISIVVMVSFTYVKFIEFYTLKYVQFFACKLFLNKAV